MAKQAGLTLSAVQERLAGGKIAPVYLISGPDNFLAGEAVQSVTQAMGANSAQFARSVFHGDSTDLATVLDEAKTLNLFSPSRLVIVSPADRFIQKHGAALAGYAASPASNACLLLRVDKADGRQKLTKTVEKAGGLVACNHLYQEHIGPWIAARVRAMKRQIEPAAAALLADFLGSDLGVIAGEIDKLTIYAADNRKITAGDVEAVSLRDRGRDIFQLADAVGMRQEKHALVALNRLLDEGEKPGGVLFMISRHLRRLWAVKELVARGETPQSAATTVGVHYYFLDKFLAQVNAFSVRELRRSCSALLRAEATLKTSRMDDRVLLETTFLRLIRRAQKTATTTRLTSRAQAVE